MVLEIGELLDVEKALLPVYDHPVVREEVKDFMKVCFVLLFGAAGDEDVFQRKEDERDAGKNVIHQLLECLSSILKPEEHAEELPEIEGSDGRLGDVCR